MRTSMRLASLALAAGLAAAAGSLPAHGQDAQHSRAVAPGAAGTPAQPRMFDVYQAIFSLPFFSGGVSAMPRDEAAWMAWPDDDVRSRAIGFFRSIGLDEAAANALFVHVRDGLRQQEMYSQRYFADVCRRKSDITSKAQLADVFAAVYAGLDRMHELFWGSFDMLDARNTEVLAAYARQRAEGMQIHPTDPATIRRDVERSSETLAQFLRRMCLQR